MHPLIAFISWQENCKIYYKTIANIFSIEKKFNRSYLAITIFGLINEDRRCGTETKRNAPLAVWVCLRTIKIIMLKAATTLVVSAWCNSFREEIMSQYVIYWCTGATYIVTNMSIYFLSGNVSTSFSVRMEVKTWCTRN